MNNEGAVLQTAVLARSPFGSKMSDARPITCPVFESIRGPPLSNLHKLLPAPPAPSGPPAHTTVSISPVVDGSMFLQTSREKIGTSALFSMSTGDCAKFSGLPLT